MIGPEYRAFGDFDRLVGPVARNAASNRGGIGIAGSSGCIGCGSGSGYRQDRRHANHLSNAADRAAFQRAAGEDFVELAVVGRSRQ